MHITIWMMLVAQIVMRDEKIVSVVNGDNFIAFRTEAKNPMVEYNSAVGFWNDDSITLHKCRDGIIYFFEEKNTVIGVIKLAIS
jgi:hypothetical protein